MFLKFNTNEDKSIRFLVFWLVLPLLAGSIIWLSSCNQNPEKEKKKNTATTTHIPVLPEDTILTQVKALADTTQSYAIYIPDKKGTLPIIFFFDAHARGALPVKKYHHLARKYGFIIAGSNNSKNGLQKAERNKILYRFMEDVEKRTPFDPARIHVSGFSGGARIASGIGLNNRNIAGVIACAAGFPNERYKPNPDFFFIGIAGNRDFNYLELETLYRQLQALGIKNAFLTFEGKHDWPPEEVMDQAFQLLQLDAMQRNLTAQDKKIIGTFQYVTEKEIESALREKDILTAYRSCKKELDFLKGLISTDNCKKQLQDIKNNKSLNTARYRHQKMLTLEQNRQKELLRAMEVKDSIWWKKELSGIYRNTKTLKNKEERLINQRLLSYLSLISYLYAKPALANNNLNEAAKFLMIYKNSDPENPEVYFMLAEYYAAAGYTAKVIPNLKKAVKMGFDEPERIKKSKYFRSFYNKPEFDSVVGACVRKAKKD